ncbi:sensor histidine kinase [Adhaeribacter radiodurans]|uniref:Histidine kinase n=1 Tax=Adhaeribacter radiodurans TaxID=2745197 RepID=A0A7L7LCC2_9BACT|nr:histidine kinase [Adhaeribacter radiodurans]QMU30019.1 histidine kinase [Adhaeribacter radiodurans]
MASLIRRNISVLIQVLVWGLVAFLVLLFQPLTSEVKLPVQFWIKQAILLGAWLGAFYLNAQVWVPRLLLPNKISWFVVAALGTAIGVVILIYLVEIGLNLPERMHQAFHQGSVRRGGKGPLFYSLIGVFIITLVVLAIGTSITTVQKWQKDAQLRQLLEQEKTSTELSFLKAQINPHFFFNTLNNIYALTMINIDSSRQALHTLSRMMRYVLYETTSGTTLLSKELGFIQDYIQLMQLRLTENVKVTFYKPNPVTEVMIAPMLLLPFVENAFKHGVSTILPCHIQIKVEQHGPNLHVNVTNTIVNEKKLVLEESSGIGLVNTRRRLDLLYSGNYQLTAGENTPENEYQVHLTINLS